MALNLVKVSKSTSGLPGIGKAPSCDKKTGYNVDEQDNDDTSSQAPNQWRQEFRFVIGPLSGT